jgi:hypothetical protein
MNKLEKSVPNCQSLTVKVPETVILRHHGLKLENSRFGRVLAQEHYSENPECWNRDCGSGKVSLDTRSDILWVDVAKATADVNCSGILEWVFRNNVRPGWPVRHLKCFVRVDEKYIFGRLRQKPGYSRSNLPFLKGRNIASKASSISCRPPYLQINRLQSIPFTFSLPCCC